MNGGASSGSSDTAELLRRLLIVLVAIGIVGTAIELAMLRHWDSAEQLIPWVALAALAVSVVLLTRQPGPQAVNATRVIAVVVALAALYGVVQHVIANYNAGPLDFRYSSRWATMSAASRWWAAFSKAVGPSPSLAPAVLAQSALCLWFATLGHPALEQRRLAQGLSAEDHGHTASPHLYGTDHRSRADPTEQTGRECRAHDGKVIAKRGRMPFFTNGARRPRTASRAGVRPWRSR